MYRLASQEGQPLLSADYVYNKYSTNKVETLHEKNLFNLGEDRYLTTLLLLKFDDMKLSFSPEATCHTVVPHTFSILLSQRRRWINSTFHNSKSLKVLVVFSLRSETHNPFRSSDRTPPGEYHVRHLLFFHASNHCFRLDLHLPPTSFYLLHWVSLH